jgi:hypothetical protein|tara:strand:- start:856 stop:1413 length:558 start_codon:yes stop_codon:yes gene_type:complete
MKNVLLIAITLMLGLTSFTQESFSEYDGNKLSVVVKPGTSQGKVYLELDKELGLVLNAKQRSKFLAFVKETYKKSCAWDSVAKANSITEMDSKYFGKLSLPGFFYYGAWKFGTTRLKLIFIIEKGESRSYLYGTKIMASDNQFMKSESIMVPLDEEFVSYISKSLTDEVIDNFITSKNKVDSLFD